MNFVVCEKYVLRKNPLHYGSLKFLEIALSDVHCSADDRFVHIDNEMSKNFH